MQCAESQLNKFSLPKLTWNDQKTVYCMSGEDGITEKIFSNIPPIHRTYVEIGINLNSDELARGRQQLQGNTVFLKERGWTGWWFDGRALPELGVDGEFFTPTNINAIFRKYDIPNEFDLFSLDVDGQDLWLWMALDFKPRVVLVEVNSHFDIYDAKTIAYDPYHRWRGDTYYGASLAAFDMLAKDKGYTLVYYNAANAFFVRSDILANAAEFVYEDIAFRKDYHPPHQDDRMWVSLR